MGFCIGLDAVVMAGIHLDAISFDYLRPNFHGFLRLAPLSILIQHFPNTIYPEL